MKIYIRAFWVGDDEFIDDPYESAVGYGDFADYDLYDYSEYADFYNLIKKRKIYVPVRVAGDIPDYNAYRKSLFGTLYLSNQSGESIEDLYYEVCTSCPGILNDDLINDTEMLLEIVAAALYAQSILAT